ncbi:hypothetical protein [Microvirgula aerodenitrificans]|uniref:gp53-like domain-containing protein n=1 Tax=Microvirgula aerodenitrificans TaxID=57480 RepID=UPI0028E704CE|nr:hypothetical protein [Microvirgula aerodenitrificans]
MSTGKNMASSDFLPFGNGPGANVVSQADYAALASRSGGFASGMAKSAQVNKVWRQTSAVSAAIGQMIADLGGQDVHDDGDTATLLAQLKSALEALGGIPEWNVSRSYPVNSYVRRGGTMWKSIVASTGQDPSTSPSYWISWGLTLADLQNAYSTFSTDTGAANTVVAAFWPAITALADGMQLRVKIKATNTGATTCKVNDLPARAIVGLAGSALQGGELVANGRALLMYSATSDSFVLLSCEGGAQTAPTPPQFDNDTSIATTAFVQQALGNWRGFAANTAGGTFTLAAADAGKTIVLSGASVTGTLVLPKIGTVPDGAGWLIKCEAVTSNWSIATHADDGANMVVGQAVASVPIRRGDYAIITRGGSSWRVHGSVCLPYGDQFTASLAVNGYQKLPGGLILQWGTIDASANNALTSLTFPIAFPFACRAFSGTVGHTVGIAVSYQNMAATGVQLCQPFTASRTVLWTAVGY